MARAIKHHLHQQRKQPLHHGHIQHGNLLHFCTPHAKMKINLYFNKLKSNQRPLRSQKAPYRCAAPTCAPKWRPKIVRSSPLVCRKSLFTLAPSSKYGARPMLDPKSFDELSKRFIEGLPSGLRSMQEDLEKHFRAQLQGFFEKLNLVTREEFDVQAQVLARTRVKVEALEQQLAAIEAKLGLVSPTEPTGSA
jgi:ubiquinone biosynthesis accessory factor UbiK